MIPHISPYVQEWAQAFATTLVIETPVFVFLLRRHCGGAARTTRLSVIVNSISHPLLWFAIPQFAPYWLWLSCAEVGVVLAEWLLLWGLTRQSHLPPPSSRRLLAASLAANSVSTAAGLLLLVIRGKS